jgi:hypothetical protein
MYRQQQLQSHKQHLSSRPSLPQFLMQGGGGSDSGLILSTDARPRLKWTPELHERFVEAVNQLGGPESGCKMGGGGGNYLSYISQTYIMTVDNDASLLCRSYTENNHEAHGDPWTDPVPS